MRQSLTFLLAVLIVTTAAQLTLGAEATPPKELQTAIEDLNQWIGEGANGQSWRNYLLAKELDEQINSGEDADKHVLRRIVAKYKSGADGLEKQRFVRVRKALEAWLEAMPAISVEELVAAVKNAKSNFVPIDDGSVQQAKGNLLATLKELDGYLGRGAKADAGRWREFLKRDEMDEALQSDKPDLRLLQAISSQYFKNEKGLEESRFVNVRTNMRKFMNAHFFAGEADIQDQHATQLDTLSETLTRYIESPNADDGIAIGRTLGWLHRANQNADLVEAIQHHYAQPNLFAQVSRRFMAVGIEEEVERQTSVRDTILGTRISGTATLTGRVSLDLIPSNDSAKMLIRLTGTANSKNVGYNRGVRVYTTGKTTIDGSKPITIDATRMHPGDAVAKCKTSTRINRIAANSAMVQKIAWKQAGSQKGQAQRIASRKAETRVKKEMNEQAAEMVGKANADIAEKVRLPLLRRGAFPQMLQLSTTAEALLVKLQQVNPFQLAAPSAPPEIDDPGDISVRIHESLVGNFTEAAIAGETLTDESLAEMIEELTGEVPQELLVTPETDAWSITFASSQPISVRFSDGKIRLAVRGRRFTRNDQQLSDLVEISSVYKVEKIDDGVKLTRDGEVKVDFLRRRSLGVTQVAFKQFLKNRFEAMFKSEFANDGVELPGRWGDAGKLSVRTVESGDGWISVAMELPNNNVAVRTASNEE